MKRFFDKIICIKAVLTTVHFCSLILLAFTSHNFAADGDLDPTFNGTGTLLVDVDIPEVINYLAIQADGKIVGVGLIDTDWALVRLNNNGTLDTTFNSTGIVITDLGTASDRLSQVKIQTDQKLVVTGSTGADSAALFATGRYNTNGLLDATFGTGGIVTTSLSGGIGNGDGASSLVIQPDGKIVVAGRADSSVGIVRYNNDGSLDTTFGTNGIVTTPVGTFANAGDVVLQADGKIVISGIAIIAGIQEFLLARYNTDGSLDTTFGTNGIVTTNVTTDAIHVGLVLQSDNKFVIGGGNDTSFILVRYNNDGSLDTTFGTGGIVTTTVDTINIAGGITLQFDQKLIFVGQTGASLATGSYTVIRYNTDGTLDTTFGTGGIVITPIDNPDRPRAVVMQKNVKIVVAGASGGASALDDFSFARYIAFDVCEPLIGSDTVLNIFNTEQFVSESGRIAKLALLQGGFSLCGDATFASCFPVVGNICLGCHTLNLENDLIMNNVSDLASVGNIIGNGHLLDLAESIATVPSLTCSPIAEGYSICP